MWVFHKKRYPSEKEKWKVRYVPMHIKLKEKNQIPKVLKIREENFHKANGIKMSSVSASYKSSEVIVTNTAPTSNIRGSHKV